jgi:hypothetical protein
MFEILILVITLLANRLNLNSTNSSKPPSSDPNRKNRPEKRAGTRPVVKEAYGLLAAAKVAHADEIGINLGGKRYWLNCLSNEQWACYHPHAKRGTDAMNDMGVLPMFAGILCHDH